MPLLTLALAGCNTTSQSGASLSGPRAATTVAFDSIDGPPRDIFDRLVRDLNAAAQRRNLPVVSRAGRSAYRVRGYLVADGAAKGHAINWVWDVYNDRQQRVLRITGKQVVDSKQPDPWQALDDPALRQIADESVDQMAVFLDSPAARTQIAYDDESSPEAAGIVRIVPTSAAAQQSPDQTAEVPLPPHRPQRAHTNTLAWAVAPYD